MRVLLGDSGTRPSRSDPNQRTSEALMRNLLALPARSAAWVAVPLLCLSGPAASAGGKKEAKAGKPGAAVAQVVQANGVLLYRDKAAAWHFLKAKDAVPVDALLV